jgi:probable addiction module antidote protein
MRRRQINPTRGHSSRQGALERLQTAKSRVEKRAGKERPAEDERGELMGRLRDLQYCSKYLSAAFRDSAGTFLVALRNVAAAQKGMSMLAAEAGVNRENLYRMLSEEGNPRLDTLWAVLKAIGLRVSLEPASALPPTRSALE